LKSNNYISSTTLDDSLWSLWWFVRQFFLVDIIKLRVLKLNFEVLKKSNETILRIDEILFEVDCIHCILYSQYSWWSTVDLIDWSSVWFEVKSFNLKVFALSWRSLILFKEWFWIDAFEMFFKYWDHIEKRYSKDFSCWNFFKISFILFFWFSFKLIVLIKMISNILKFEKIFNSKALYEGVWSFNNVLYAIWISLYSLLLGF